MRPAGVCGVSWVRSCLLLPARRGWSRGADAGSSHPVGGTRGSQAEPRERPHGELGHWLGRGMGPAAFPRAERSGDPAPGLEHPSAAGQAVQRPPAEGLGPLGFGSSVDDGPGSRGTARSRGVHPPHLPKCVGSVGGSPEIGGAPGPLCTFERGRVGDLRPRVLLSPPAGPHAHLAARPRPPGVPSGSAVPRAQAHRAEALQRVPRAAQAGEAAPPTDRPTLARLLSSSWETGGRTAAPASATPVTAPLPPSWAQTSLRDSGWMQRGRAQLVPSMPVA